MQRAVRIQRGVHGAPRDPVSPRSPPCQSMLCTSTCPAFASRCAAGHPSYGGAPAVRTEESTLRIQVIAQRRTVRIGRLIIRRDADRQRRYEDRRVIFARIRQVNLDSIETHLDRRLPVAHCLEAFVEKAEERAPSPAVIARACERRIKDYAVPFELIPQTP
ncbi:MAG: hypothetical protein SYC29_06465 [Planctomycetota bacterium]|nr:hypothetical protein [Planctomycetota bacterium]